MDWTDIEAKLCERAEEVCRHLLPNGQRDGSEWVCGSLAGEKGNSLKVNLAGKVGVWSDFADSGKSGKSLTSLWMRAKGLARFGHAVVEAKRWLGIADDFEKRVKAYPQPKSGGGEQTESSAYSAVAETWARCQPLTKGGPVWNYLVNERKICTSALMLYDIREYLSHGQWAMVFPYYTPATEADAMRAAVGNAVLGTSQPPEWLKFERLDRPNGKKKEWTSRSPKKTLFGVQLAESVLASQAFKDASQVLICEGEKDALTWLSYGCIEWGVIPVSVPFGAKWKGQDKDRPSPNREWLDSCWDWLQSFETVLVAMDSDDAGRRAAADIIAEVGPRRCRLVEMPKDAAGKQYKDANDCLLANVEALEMRYQVEHGRDFAPEKVVAMADREEEFLTWVFERELEPGVALPFEFPFRIRPGEMTVWTGIEGSGKTTLLDFVLVAAIHQGERGFIASFEVPWQQTLEKVNRQALGELLYDKRIVKRSTPEAVTNYRAVAREQTRRAYRWLAPNIWFYDHVGIGRWRTLIDDIRWTRRRHGTTQVAIDNFMRLGIAKDDYAQQADAITAFASLAMELGIHIHMVVHQNKTEGKKDSGGKRSVSGAFEIIANAHNIVEVIRDKSKGEKVSELYEAQKIGAITSDTEFNSKKRALDLLPDGNFTLHKQRNGDVQDGRKYLWFLWESQQYADKPPGHPEHAPVRFVSKGEQRRVTQADLPTNEEMDEF